MEEIITFFASIKVPSTITHVLSVVVGMGAALVSDVLFTFYAKDKKLNKTEQKSLEILSTVVWWSLLVIGISGVALFMSNPSTYMVSSKFMAKITILAVLIANGVMLNFFVWRHLSRPNFFTSKKELPTRKIAFTGGAISVISWLSVCALGVLDHSPFNYKILMSVYVCVIIAGIFVALYVEDRKFERKS